jgi:hypothetical protein
MTATIEVTAYALNVRTGAGINYPAPHVMSKGQQATADADNFLYGTWLHIVAPFDGYVSTGTAAVPLVRLINITISPTPPSSTYKVKATANLNVRAVPSTINNTPLFYVEAGTLLNAEGLNNGWYKLAGVQQYVSAQYATRVDSSPAPAPSSPPAPPPSPSSFSLPFNAMLYGGHMNPGGWVPGDAELDVFRRNHINYALIPAYNLNQQGSIARLRSVGVQHFLIRPAFNGGTTAAHFAEITLPILEQYAVALGGSNNMLIQLGNEPNLVEEGWTKFWQAGSDFAIWWLNVAGVYRANLPGCKIGFAPMSPGGNEQGVRRDELQFLAGCTAAIKSADFAVVHNYWARSDGSDLEVPLTKWRRSFGNLPLVIGESGPPLVSPVVTKEAVQHSHIMYIQAGIPAIYFIMDSSEDQRFNNAGWLQEKIVV